MVEAFLGIQIVAVSFAGFMLYVAFMHFKRNNINRTEFLFWLTVWSVFGYFVLFPKVLDPILANLFIIRAMDLLSISAFMILAYLGFQNHVGIKSLQKDLEKMVRRKALEHPNGKKQ